MKIENKLFRNLSSKLLMDKLIVKSDNYYREIKLPLIEKYRPRNFNDIILNNFLKIKLNNILKSKQLPNLIIIGEPSTGKTSTILCLAKIIYKDDYENNVLELNASDDRGLTMISSTIQPFCKKKSNYNKLVILDEADSITQKAQNLLNNIIAEYRKNTRFIFICNQNARISESIQSRCMILKFPKIKKKQIKEKIIEICQNEKTKYTDDGINRLLFFSDYDIRQCINNLECIIYTNNSVTIKTIDNLINVPKVEYIKKIIELCKEKNLDEALLVITKLFNNGYSSNDILLIFMKYIEYNQIDNIDHEMKLKLYKIISSSYIRVNDGINTLLQLYGCISNIYQLLFA